MEADAKVKYCKCAKCKKPIKEDWAYWDNVPLGLESNLICKECAGAV